MNKKLLFIPFFFLIQTFAVELFAQQFIPIPAKPSICTTPPAGYLLGGRFELSPQYGITKSTSPLADLRIKNVPDPNRANIVLDNAELFTDITNTFNIATATNGIPFTVSNEINTQKAPGYYWIMLKGEKGSQKYLTCLLYESLYGLKPVVNVNTCTGTNINLSIPADPANKFDKYEVTWAPGDKQIITVAAGQVFPITFSKTFPVLPPSILVRGGYVRAGVGEIWDSEYNTISPNGSKAPFITRLEGENYGSEATLNFVNFENNFRYNVFAKVDDANPSNAWNKVAEGQNGAVKVTGLSPTTKYCFKLTAPGACATPVESQNTVCSIVIRSNLKNSKEVDLSWNLPLLPSAALSDLKLRETITPGTNSPNNLPLPTKATTMKNITTLDCSKKYEYVVSARFPPIVVIGVPLTQAVEVISAPHKVDPKANALSVKPSSIAQVDYDPLDDNKINITVFEPSASSSFLNNYTFFRAENNSPNFIRLGTASTNSFTDVSLIVGDAKSYCYKYQKTDDCGIISELSDPFCTILLTNPKINLLNWTPYLVPPSLVTSANPSEYVVTWYDEDTGAYMPDITTTNLSATIEKVLKLADKSKVKFKIRGRQFVSTSDFPAGQFISSSSNVVEVPNPPKLYIPNAFTPNDDTLNSKFIVYTKFITSGKLRIFDRWGGSIHEGDISEGWDGNEKSKNSPAPSGTYPYVIDAISNEGQKIKSKGTVLLIR